VIRDIELALGMFRRNPSTAAAAVLTTTLGVRFGSHRESQSNWINLRDLVELGRGAKFTVNLSARGEPARVVAGQTSGPFPIETVLPSTGAQMQ
jgi:hypothetical protein